MRVLRKVVNRVFKLWPGNTVASAHMLRSVLIISNHKHSNRGMCIYIYIYALCIVQYTLYIIHYTLYIIQYYTINYGLKSQNYGPLLMLTSACLLKVRNSQGLGPFSQIEPLKTDRTMHYGRFPTYDNLAFINSGRFPTSSLHFNKK